MTGDQPLSHMSHGSNGLRITVVMVALESVVTNLLEAAFSSKGWDVDYSHHRDYLSRTGRPSSLSSAGSASQYIALVNFDPSITHALETARYLSHAYAGKITIIAVAARLDSDRMLTAMRAGCSEFLSDPFSHALPELLDRLEARWLTPGAMPLKAQGSILTLFGSKGGVGATTLAVHLAIFLVQRHSKRTLLIDHHWELGHACVYLGMDGSGCLFREVVRNLHRVDGELLRGFVGHHPSGLDVLSSSDVGLSDIAEDPEAVTRTLSFLRSEYEYIVIDSTPPRDETGIAILEASSQFYAVTSPEIGALRDLSRHMDRLTSNQALTEKLRIVLNRAGTPNDIHADQIEKAVKLPVEIRLPDCSVELIRSQNLGEPISPHSKSEMAQAMKRWVDSIVGGTGKTKPTAWKSGLSSLLKQGLAPRTVTNRAQ